MATRKRMGSSLVFHSTKYLGKRIRVAIYHSGAWRPLLWLRVGRDGSIYTGMLLGRPSHAQIISTELSGDYVDVTYSEGQPLSDDDMPDSSRVSFKVSGDIHFIGDIALQGVRLETLSKPTQLCLLTFVHPDRYKPPIRKQADEYDIGIQEYLVVDECPMYGALYLAPWSADSQVQEFAMETMTTYASVTLVFQGLTRTPDLALQFLIGHGLRGDWPEYPSISVFSKKPLPGRFHRTPTL